MSKNIRRLKHHPRAQGEGDGYLARLAAVGAALNSDSALNVHSEKTSGPTSNSRGFHFSDMMSSSAQYSKAPPKGLWMYQKQAEEG